MLAQYGTPHPTSAHDKVGKKFAAFPGYSRAQEKQIKAVGEDFIRKLSQLHSKYMSLALRAVGDPSLLQASTATQQDKEAPAAPPSATAPPSAATAAAPSATASEDEDRETGEGWEIPVAELQ